MLIHRSSNPFPRAFIAAPLALIFLAAAPPSAHAADWRACEQAKLRQLAAQKSAKGSAGKKKSGGRKSPAAQRSEDIETWLWKNCREFSYELRNLEQEKM